MPVYGGSAAPRRTPSCSGARACLPESKREEALVDSALRLRNLAVRSRHQRRQHALLLSRGVSGCVGTDRQAHEGQGPFHTSQGGQGLATRFELLLREGIIDKAVNDDSPNIAIKNGGYRHRAQPAQAVKKEEWMNYCNGYALNGYTPRRGEAAALDVRGTSTLALLWLTSTIV
jgi:hypothetical protein